MSTVDSKGMPHTSTMLFHVDNKFRIYFATHADSMKIDQLKKIPIYILSKLGSKEDKKLAMSLGAKKYFHKLTFPISDIVRDLGLAGK